ncbi:DUF2382 domain-containing protein [Myxosarcina sp. GI1]|uniref:DUF2382 domain-containing protein n=1 Tax=Myxosarcina sp. GI1 TaxID=1541065 RepID=UPI00068FF657|nr:DUF2382 domain-containing protein [Myxosarcina sp. GI1]
MANLDDRSQANLSYLIDKLGKQLITYRVTDSSGVVIAEVADLYRDERNNLYLLIQLIEQTSDSNWYQLSESNIALIDMEKQTITTNLSLPELTKLPLANSLSTSLPIEFEKIPLLEEKLTVKRYRRKVGEIVVRKEIETRMVQIPIRSEKLVVERVGAEPEVLSEVELGTERVFLTDSPELAASYKSKFVNIDTARQILQALERETNDEAKVRLEIITADETQRNIYRSICQRFS